MQVGQQVSGKYMGQAAFTGVITEMRSLTVKTDGCFEFSIELDAPINVFGQERRNVMVFAKFDGTPSSYTKFTDSIQ